jgi:cytokinesis protein
MRRKAGNVNPLSPSALSDGSDGPKSPASTGAMDELLQKLRAAKPEARDQRDRRRRARLKDRHQVRVASGQKIPELGVNMETEEDGDDSRGMLSPKSEGDESVDSAALTSPTDAAGGDVADRAAAMLEGLQGGASMNKDGSLNVRRRRENADNERERRRRRRQQASTASSARSDRRRHKKRQHCICDRLRYTGHANHHCQPAQPRADKRR